MTFSRPFGDGSVHIPARRRCASAGEHYSSLNHVGWRAGGGSCLTSDTRRHLAQRDVAGLSRANMSRPASSLLLQKPPYRDLSTTLAILVKNRNWQWINFQGPVCLSRTFLTSFVASGLIYSAGLILVGIGIVQANTLPAAAGYLVAVGAPLFGLGAMFG